VLMPAILALGAAVLEARQHDARVSRIRHRIHVNGTRGKSSVVRLVAAGLRRGGLRVVAKTTGSAPRVLLPDGSEVDPRGRRRPSLLEYRAVVATAVRLRADVLVVECMAVRPELQRVAEHRLLRSTIGVLTGAAPDHLGIMGASPGEIVEALGETVPAGAVLVVGPDAPEPWVARARALATAVHIAEPVSGLPRPVGNVEWPENVALALEVCRAAGVSRETALDGMRGARPDLGALRVWRCRRGSGGDLWLVGAFAANDPLSSQRVVRRVREEFKLAGLPVIGVLNTRADRGERTLQWCRALIAGTTGLERLVVTGPHASAAVRLLHRAGWTPARVRALGAAPPAVVTAAASQLGDGQECVIVGLGNLRGGGAALLAHWASTAGEPEAGEAPGRDGRGAL
jgi:poly-gamma-glutamate synthase PgsB/CapB